jgi:hypothetical protein
MSFIDATSEYGIVVRKAALAERGVSFDDLTLVMTDVDVNGESESLVSYGPLFGIEAQDNLKTGLADLGLIDIDDFFGLDFLLPEWARLGVAFNG